MAEDKNPARQRTNVVVFRDDVPLSDPYAVLETVKTDDITDILIGGYKADGGLYMRSSNMTRAEALWLIEQLRLHVCDVAVAADLD